jgi:hypothetical protein
MKAPATIVIGSRMGLVVGEDGRVFGCFMALVKLYGSQSRRKNGGNSTEKIKSTDR